METTSQKLPKKFKKDWIAALRSGKYKQGRWCSVQPDNAGYLFCCMAVAGVVNKGLADMDTMQTNSYTNLPKAINGGHSNETVKVLINMNDAQNRSFAEIADYIEENL